MKQSVYHLMIEGNRIDVVIIYRRRQTLEIAVRADGVVVRAPEGLSYDKIVATIERKAGWIERKLQDFTKRQVVPPQSYVEGSLHLYLGKKHRLHCRLGATEALVMHRGVFWVTTTQPPTPLKIQVMLEQWYAEHASDYFLRRMATMWQRFSLIGKMPPLVVRPMKTRWGSLSPRNVVTLNLALIRAPVVCIDYVILHEYCHLIHRNHSAAFYDLLEKFEPDWQQRRQQLEALRLLG